MGGPSFFNKLTDRIHVATHRGVRIRIWNEAQAGFQLRVVGDTKSLRSHLDRLMVALYDLKPEGSGTVDAFMSGANCTLRVNVSPDEDNLEQRLRNMLQSR